jgi:RHS repeat-associated protein
MTGLTQFNNTVTQYVYDNANRLTSITSPVASYSFTLDDNGNRTASTQTTPASINVSPSNTSFNMNTPKNRLMQAGSDSLQYNNEGELASKGTNSYTFDYAHRLVNINNGATSYTYDGAGNRIAATRDGVTTKYIYDASGNLIAEADASGTITKYYIYGTGLLAMVPNDNQNQFYCYHFDGTGNTVALTDSSANVVDSYAYTPFGAVTQNETVGLEQPFKFVGQAGVMAEPNGFYYMRARYYDSSVGRFISEDPKGFDGGDVNLSAYVGNNPINAIDPLGLWRWPDYYSVNVSFGFIGWAGNITVDRDLDVYVAPIGVGAGIKPGGSFSATANWLNQHSTPSESQLQSFLSGSGFTDTIGYWVGGSESWSSDGRQATGVGFATPQAGISWNYSFQVHTGAPQGTNGTTMNVTGGNNAIDISLFRKNF